jgi:hypothetical protein
MSPEKQHPDIRTLETIKQSEEYQTFIEPYKKDEADVVVIDGLIESYIGKNNDLCDEEDVTGIIDEVLETPIGMRLDEDDRFP